MRKVLAWLGAATLYMLMSVRADAANDVLKPYVVLILDTSDSMLIPTGSGPTSCGKADNRLNHAVCAINNIVQSYGDMVFALGRYRETSTATSGTPGTQICDSDNDQDGNENATLGSAPGLIAPPTGGNVCNTQGAVCGDCNATTGTQKTCTVATQATDCLSDTCNVAAETACGTPPVDASDAIDNDNDGFINDGCPAQNGAGAESNCTDAIDNDGDGYINDGCPTVGQCAGTFGCTNADSNFELLAPLVDGQNANAGKFVDGVCNSCDPTMGNPELWGVGITFTPVSGTLLGAKRYWQGLQATDGTTIWNSSSAGYDPINRDPNNNVFLTATATNGCNPNPTSCVNVAETDCTTTGVGGTATDDDTLGTGSIQVPDGFVNDGCPAVGPAETNCGDNVDNDNDGVANDGCPAQCSGTNCCCAQQCRPYITIMLADGDETCTSFSNTLTSAASLLDTRPHSDAVALSALSRNGTQASASTSAPHALAVGDSVAVLGTGGGTFDGTFKVLSVGAMTLTYDDTRTAGTATVAGASIGHVSGMLGYKYRVEVKPIGFGVPIGDANIEALAHAGGAPDLPGVNEGYYAADEADLQLAISDILADSVRSELCNSKDDDCDTRIDEDFPLVGTPQSTGSAPWPDAQNCPAICAGGLPCVGRCAATGKYLCDGTGGVRCNAVPGTPVAETCNNIDDDCNGLIDDGIPCSSCVPTAEVCNGMSESCGQCPADQTRHCSNNATRACVVNSDCTGGGTCSGACTTLTRACAIGTGVGVCSGVEQCVPVAGPPPSGSYDPDTCTAQQGTEVCDGVDNNCDGICDGIDVSCSTIGQACNAANQASCPGSVNPGSPNHVPPPIPENICRPGTRTCAQKAVCGGSNSFSACVGEIKPYNGVACTPDTSATPPATGCDGCNGLDDDCDNEIDEDFRASDCSNNCGLGKTKCSDGTDPAHPTVGEIYCDSPAGTNGDKTCNNIDDDCDNVKDEDWKCGDPTSVPFVPCTCGAGLDPKICNGVNKCVDGGVVCQGPFAEDEVCNCKDDDCDGTIDEDPVPGTDICDTNPSDPNNPVGTCLPSSCQCAFGCVESEFPCPVGRKCEVEDRCSPTATNAYALCDMNSDCPSGTCTEAKFCVTDPCFDVTCPAVNGNLQTCQPKADNPANHECVDICSLINDGDNSNYPSCPSGFVCLGSAGECRPDNCLTFPDRCSTDEACVNGQCVGNPCSGITCDAGKYCLGGTCVPSCADVTCATGQRCRQGVCEPDPCGDEHCPFGEVCNDASGQCIEDPCKSRQCPTGQWCNPNDGQCEDDPCVTNDITCPNDDEVCRGGTCLDPDTLRPDAAGESHVTVGGGGGCSTTGGGSGLVLALGMLLVRRRRRTVSDTARTAGGAS